MNQFPLVTFCNLHETHFEYKIVTHLARVSEEFLSRCEQEELIKARIMPHGVKGLCFTEVRKLKLIRYLHEDLGLDLGAVDLILRYRERIKVMKRQIGEMEQRLRQKELEHQAEVLDLCRHLERCDVGGDAWPGRKRD